jgi:hypothetical protein
MFYAALGAMNAGRENAIKMEFLMSETEKIKEKKMEEKKIADYLKMKEEENNARRNVVGRVLEKVRRRSVRQREEAVGTNRVLKKHLKGQTTHKHRHKGSPSIRALRSVSMVAEAVVRERKGKEQKKTDKKWVKREGGFFFSLVFLCFSKRTQM